MQDQFTNDKVPKSQVCYARWLLDANNLKNYKEYFEADCYFYVYHPDMFTTIAVRNRNISVRFRKHAVSIVTDAELSRLLAHDARSATSELVMAIKKTYQQLFTTDFIVSNRSFAVEIWGHVYADKLANRIKTLTAIAFVRSGADFVIRRSRIIDVGERRHDSNRFVWNMLAPFHAVIASFLP